MYYIGVDLGGTNIAVGIVDENGNILKKGSVPTGALRDPDEIVKDMAELAKKLLSETGISLDEVEYAGIAAPGTIDSEKGEVVYSNNIPLLHYPMAKKLKDFLGVKKVYIENDANAAAKGEYACGVSKGSKSAVLITLGTGLGGGIVIDNKIYSGFNFGGAELGHTVIEVDGRPCTCGRRGCWETYSSATGLIKMTKEKMEECRDSLMWTLCDGDISKVSGRTAFDAMKKGDAAAKDVVDMYIKYLGIGITNMINIFQPEMFVIGGGVCNEKEHLTLPLNEIIEKDQYTRNNPPELKTKVCIAQLGNDAGIIGAAMLGK